MEKNAFLGEGEEEKWWLLETDLDPNLEQVRTQVGHSFDWDERWYENPTQLEELYQYIENDARQLLTELDEVGDDRDKRLAWMTSLAELRGVGQEEEAEQEEDGPAAAQTVTGQEEEAEGQEEETGEWDDGWQMLYRVVGDEYQYAVSDDQRTIRPGEHWMSADEAATVRAQRSAGQEEETGSHEEQGQEEEAAASWDDNWHMLYRLGPDGQYEYALSDDQKTVNPGAVWMTQAEATASLSARPAAATGGQEEDTEQAAGATEHEDMAAALASLTPQETEQVVESAVQDVMSDLFAADKQAELAQELGLDEAQLQELLSELPDDFADMLKEAGMAEGLS